MILPYINYFSNNLELNYNININENDEDESEKEEINHNLNATEDNDEEYILDIIIQLFYRLIEKDFEQRDKILDKIISDTFNI